MKQFSRIDDEGFEIETVLISENEELTPDIVPANEGNPNGLFKPKWDKVLKKWVEGFEVEEVEKRKKAIEIDTILNDALTYLNQTDWYIVRQLDNGKQVPEEVIEKRQKARNLISENRKE